jgi:hypothetical protein
VRAHYLATGQLRVNPLCRDELWRLLVDVANAHGARIDAGHTECHERECMRAAGALASRVLRAGRS